MVILETQNQMLSEWKPTKSNLTVPPKWVLLTENCNIICKKKKSSHQTHCRAQNYRSSSRLSFTKRKHFISEKNEDKIECFILDSRKVPKRQLEN